MLKIMQNKKFNKKLKNLYKDKKENIIYKIMELKKHNKNKYSNLFNIYFIYLTYLFNLFNYFFN